MTSVKGMTWGSPEFVAVTKAAERDGTTDEQFAGLVEQVIEATIEMNVSKACYEKARRALSDAFALGCDCE